jgi:uncharacterized membrane protein YfcA
VEIAALARASEHFLRHSRSVVEHEIAVQIQRADSRALSDCIQCFLFLQTIAQAHPQPLECRHCGRGLAGFLAGVIGTGGAIRGMALAAFDLEKSVFVATSAAIDSGVDFSRAIVYLRANYLSSAFYWYVPGLLLVAFVGSYVGKIALNKLHQKNFRRIVLVLVFLIGLTTLGKFVEQLSR